MLFESFFVFVCIYNIFYQAMTDDIARIEFDNTYAFDVFQQSYRMDKAGHVFFREVYLTRISGYDAFGIYSHTGKEHFHLVVGGILSFVENDEGIVERTSSHIGERGDLNHVGGNIFL